MLYIDAKYVGLISYKLRNFKRKNDNYWNFSCPICGDSKKNPLKARGFVFKHQNRLVYKCHNCSYSSNVGSLIKFLDPILYNEYVLEKYKESSDNTYIKPIQEFVPEPKVELKDGVLDELSCLSDLPDTHPAVRYLLDRKIPRDKLKLFYYTEKFKEWSNKFKYQFMHLETDHPRIVIPFMNKHGKVFMYQGRGLNNEMPKYIAVKLDDKEEKVYGLDRVNYANKVFVVEGPIDSIFLPNGIAVGGADFDIPLVASIKPNCVLVPDNEPRNTEIVKMINKYIEKGYSVCLWPDFVREKDINEMVLTGRSINQILETINTNTFQGMEAKLRFSTWKKI